MTRAERLVVGAWLALAGFAPDLAALAARGSTFAGTEAEVVYLVERGGPESAAAAQALAELGERSSPTFPVAFALGRQARRRGQVQEAVAWLRRAAELRPESPEALTELGNALVLLDDVEGARESYQRAAERAPALAQPWFNLARLYGRRAQLAAREEASVELSRSQEFVRKAIEVDPRLGLVAAGELDLRANHFLAPLPLAMESVLEAARASANADRVGAQVGRLLFGRVPGGFEGIVALAAVLLLVLGSLASRVIAPSGGCSKCGRPACGRCDEEVVGPGLCGQCINVFNQRQAVDPPARVAKELGIKRYQRQRERVIKAAALVASGAGQVLLGSPVAGALHLVALAFLAFQVALPEGVMPVPSGAMPPLLRIVPAALVLLVLHVVAVRRAFKRFRLARS